MGEPDTTQWCASEQPGAPSQDTRQLIGADVATALCHTGWQRLLITGMLRDLLVHHYSTPDHIEIPDLRNALWREMPPTGILIESLYRWRGDLTEMRPAILIKPNAYKNVRMGIADKWVVDGEGNQNYVTLWVGSHTLFCIHGTGASAEILATETQREITQFAPVITRMLGLTKFKVNQVGQISELEEATENFVVPIDIGWAYQEKWKLEPEALKLRGIEFSFDLDC